MKNSLTKSTIIFVALVIAGICLIVFGQGAANSVASKVLPLVGASIFTAGLTYFLVKVG